MLSCPPPLRPLLGALALFASGLALAADQVVRREPVISGQDSQFAYTQTAAAGATHLRLAQLTAVHPHPQARDLALLATIDSTGGAHNQLVHLEVSPDNALLLAYVFQSNPPEATDAFVDHNLSLHLMRTGARLEFINEHRFSTLNKAAWSSLRLAEYLDRLMTTGGLDAASAARFDYRVQVEGADIAVPTYRWYRDGSLAISFNLAVHVIFPGGGPGPYAGMETFTRTYRRRGDVLEFARWGPPSGPVDIRRDCFLLRAGAPGEEGTLTFEAQTIKFLPTPDHPPSGERRAGKVVGDIPRRTR